MHNDYHIVVKFKGVDGLKIQFRPTCVTERYCQLLKKNYQTSPPLFRDHASYTKTRMLELVEQARVALGWDWSAQDYDTATSVALHKDLETFLAPGFANIPKEHDDLMHELHICLHSLQADQQRNTIQIEWFNDDGFALPDEFEHVHDVSFGDVRLQNPYVGHIPRVVYGTNDSENIPQTCRFHDHVRPGLAILANPNIPTGSFDTDEQQKYLAWFQQHAPDWYDLHGEQKLLHYAGHAIIGRVLNLAALHQLVTLPVIEFEHMEFMY
jgi:hypothetical protein